MYFITCIIMSVLPRCASKVYLLFGGLHSWDPLEFYLFTSFKAGHMEATKATVTSDTSMEIFTFPPQKKSSVVEDTILLT